MMNLTSFFNQVKQVELLVLTKHLSVMLKSGVPIGEALGILVDQSSGNVKRAVKKIQKSVDNGQALNKAMGEIPYVFNDFYVNLIKIGESSGNLSENLDYLAEYLQTDYTTKKRVQGALLYPGLILSATVIIGAFVAFYILPQLLIFFDSFETDLPLSTKILLFVATSARDYGLYILGFLGVLTIGALFLVTLPPVKYLWHLVVTKVPIFGKIVVDYQLARFCRNLALLLRSGVPIVVALETTKEATENLVFKRVVGKILNSVQKGKYLGDSIQNEGKGVFPLMVSRMASVGDKTGKLDEILKYLGTYYDEEIENVSKNLSTILEPMLLIFIGLAVGFLALSIISPIYELTSSLSQ